MATYDIACDTVDCSERGVVKTLDEDVYELAQKYETGVTCGKCGETMHQLPESA